MNQCFLLRMVLKECMVGYIHAHLFEKSWQKVMAKLSLFVQLLIFSKPNKRHYILCWTFVQYMNPYFSVKSEFLIFLFFLLNFLSFYNKIDTLQRMEASLVLSRSHLTHWYESGYRVDNTLCFSFIIKARMP